MYVCTVLKALNEKKDNKNIYLIFCSKHDYTLIKQHSKKALHVLKAIHGFTFETAVNQHNNNENLLCYWIVLQIMKIAFETLWENPVLDSLLKGNQNEWFR